MRKSDYPILPSFEKIEQMVPASMYCLFSSDPLVPAKDEGHAPRKSNVGRSNSSSIWLKRGENKGGQISMMFKFKLQDRKMLCVQCSLDRAMRSLYMLDVSGPREHMSNNYRIGPHEHMSNNYRIPLVN